MMASNKNINVMWFRQDLRLADNPALTNALEDGKTLPIFILDDVNSKEHVNGAASKWWLHHSLIKLNISLKNKLCFFRGNPLDILDEINKQFEISNIFILFPAKAAIIAPTIITDEIALVTDIRGVCNDGVTLHTT